MFIFVNVSNWSKEHIIPYVSFKQLIFLRYSFILGIFFQITVEGRKQALSIESRNLFYEILCALVNPKRKDTRGFSHFTEVTESFAFSLLTDVTCGSPGEK